MIDDRVGLSRRHLGLTPAWIPDGLHGRPWNSTGRASGGFTGRAVPASAEVTVVVLVVSVGFAFVVGVSGPPNVRASLLAARAAPYAAVMALSTVMHSAGGLIAGWALAFTPPSLGHVPARHLAAVYLAGGTVSIGFTFFATRHRAPVSASIAVGAGLTGAAAVASGWRVAGYGGFHWFPPYGVIGTVPAIVLSPVVGCRPPASG